MGESGIHHMAFWSGDEDQVGIVLNEASSMVRGKNRRRECQNALVCVTVVAADYET